MAQKAVLTQFGCPLKYYVDNHSIFRYVEKRDAGGITKLDQARQVLYEELHQYNYKRVHSTTGEIPFFAMKRLLRKIEVCFGNLKSPGLIKLLMIFSVIDSKARWTRIEGSPGTP